MKLASTKFLQIAAGKIFLIIFILILTISPLSFSQNAEPRFEHLTVKDGLPEGTVKAMLQDYLGYMWFYTQYGLGKYDGYEMKVYGYSEDSTGTSGISGLSLYEDRGKNLWVGTWASGLNRYNRATESFNHYVHSADDTSSIGADMIYSMYEDSKGRFWIGNDNGLDLHDRKSGKFKHFYFSDKSYPNEIYDYIFSKKKDHKNVESILRVGNDADIVKAFTIKKEMPVLIVMMGDAGYDYGWLEDSEGKILFDYDYLKTVHAGGSFNNRIQCELIKLSEGTYQLHYKSNYFYSYEDLFQKNNSWDYEIRTGEPPDNQELWGIQIIEVSDDYKKVEELLKKVKNIRVKSKVFTIIENEITGQIYVGTNSSGLWVLNEKNGMIEKLNISFNNHSKGEFGSVETFYKGRDGKIWIATTVGLCKLDPAIKNVTLFQPTPTLKDIKNNHLNSLAEDADGNIWAGSVISGLLKFNVSEHKFYKYVKDKKDPFSISNNLILSILFDRTGILWVGYWGNGASKWDQKKWKFEKYEVLNDINDSKNKTITTIYEDKNRNLWMGTFEGLYNYNTSKKFLKYFFHDINNQNSLVCDSIVYICGDNYNSDIIWIATNNGLDQFNSQTETFLHYQHKLGVPTSLDDNWVIHLLVDHEGTVWVGTGGGLNRFDRKVGKFQRFTGYNQAEGVVGSSNINFIYEDNTNRLWLGYNGVGLLEFDRVSKNIKSFLTSLNGEYITSIQTMCEDKNRNLWIGTYMEGIYIFDKSKGMVVDRFTIAEGLIDNKIASIIMDDKDNMWLTNHSGLTRYNADKKEFKHYSNSEGLVVNATDSWYPLFKNIDGKIYYCGENGFNLFNPEDIVDDPTPPQVIIKKVSLFNRPDEKIEYDGFISELKELSLPYNQNDLSFQYVGFHYGEPLRNQYKYILDGFDENWIDAGNLRTATYTNLDPGEYVFRVKASNRDGVWNEKGASIIIIINPPLWATTWAYMFYVLAFISLVYFTWKLQLKRIRVMQEFEMGRFEAKKLHEVDEMKSRFFTNISHEFRTPLTLILGPVKQMIEKLNEGKMKDDLSLVHRNANKLLGLVNQLLDISKIESGNMKLKTTPQNFIPLLKALVLSFTSYAERKQLTLKFNSSEDEIIVYLDREKIEKIFSNLLSNAFKFTQNGGSIETGVTKDNSYLKVVISDTGIGIPKEKLTRIFDRFYQVDGSHTREQEGTGIGLSLTKELVELHKGRIEVESEEGKGTTFTVSFPLGKDHLEPDEIFGREPEVSQVIPEISDDISKTETSTIVLENLGKDSFPLLLIVEDNKDVRYYIKDNLKNDYRIIEAIDGEDGWNKSIEQIPDLIVSDVMMPRMDGFKLCEKLKTDERTSHIPIVLLTAKAAKSDKLEGYETGADEYLMKPFEPDELKARIKNLIAQRERLQEHFQKQGISGLNQQKIASVDKKFLEKVSREINNHISDSSFSVEVIVNDLAISRSVLHRKVLSLTGETPGDLIRRIRLNKAAELIKQKFGNLSEIALEVGYNNPAHFSEAFKKQFGVSPSQYQQKNTYS